MIRFLPPAQPIPPPSRQTGSAAVARRRLQAAIGRDHPAPRSGDPATVALLAALLNEQLPEPARRRP